MLYTMHTRFMWFIKNNNNNDKENPILLIHASKAN